MIKAWGYFIGDNDENTKSDVTPKHSSMPQHIVHLDASLVPSTVPEFVKRQHNVHGRLENIVRLRVSDASLEADIDRPTEQIQAGQVQHNRKNQKGDHCKTCEITECKESGLSIRNKTQLTYGEESATSSAKKNDISLSSDSDSDSDSNKNGEISNPIQIEGGEGYKEMDILNEDFPSGPPVKVFPEEKKEFNGMQTKVSCHSIGEININVNGRQLMHNNNVLYEQASTKLKSNQESTTSNAKINASLTLNKVKDSFNSIKEDDSILQTNEDASISQQYHTHSSTQKSSGKRWSFLSFFRTQLDNNLDNVDIPVGFEECVLPLKRGPTKEYLQNTYRDVETVHTSPMVPSNLIDSDIQNSNEVLKDSNDPLEEEKTSSESHLSGFEISEDLNVHCENRCNHEDSSSESELVHNDCVEEGSRASSNITDSDTQTDNEVIICTRDQHTEKCTPSDSNTIGVEGSKEAELHEYRDFVSKCQEDASNGIRLVETDCLEGGSMALSGIIDSKNQANNGLVIEVSNSHAEEEALSESDPFGFEVTKETEVNNENRAKSLDDDPFGFEAADQDTLLESFRINDADCSKEENFSHRKRLQNMISTKIIDCIEPHPNQALFDILDRNIDSFNPSQTHINNWNINADDVKLCFVALVMILSPPKPTPYAEEFNHNLDEKIQLNETYSPQNSMSFRSRRWFFQRSDINFRSHQDCVDDVSKDGSEVESTSAEKEKENYTCIYIPIVVVHALWTEVLKNGTIQPRFIAEEADTRSSIFKCITESLVQLELVDLDTNSKQINATNRDKEENVVFQTLEKDQIALQGPSNDSEMIAVHHAISQQYGEYLGASQFSSLFNEKEEVFFSAVASLHLEDSTRLDEYKISLLPHIIIQAGNHQDAKVLLCDRNFIRKRLQFLGILVGTTAQVTDIDELLASMYDKREYRPYNAKEIIVTAYEQVRKYIERSLKGVSSKVHSDRDNIEDISMCTEAGKAFHLMAVSLGGQGIADKENKYFNTALRLKQLGSKNKNESTISISDTLHCMGFMYDNSGNFKEAIASYDQALKIRRALLGDDNLKVAETCHNKGAILSENNQFEDAIFFLEKALKIRIRHLGEEHESVADTQQWMGNIMRELGDSNEALDYFKNALHIKKSRLGDDDEDVASVFHNMAIVLDDLCDYQASIRCYTEALRIREIHYDRNSLIVADTLQSIGISYSASGDHDNALANFTNSVAIRENLLNTDTAVDLFSECHIADLQPVTDNVNLQYNKLIECYEVIIPLAKVFNTDRVNVVSLLQRMGETHSKLQDWNNAIDSLQGALNLKLNNNPGSDYDLESVGLLQKVGQVHILKGEYTKAHSYLNDALIKRKGLLNNISIPSQNHHDDVDVEFVKKRETTIALDKDQSMKSLAMNYYLIGVCFNKLNQHQQALISFTECLRILKVNNKRDILIGHTLHWLGRQHHGLQEYNKAISRYVSTLEIYRLNKSCVSHQVVVQTLHSLGNSHFKNDQLQMALKCYNEEIKISETAQSLRNSSNVAEAFYCAGNIYARMKCYDKAVSSFEHSLTEMHVEDGTENIRVAKGLDKLGTMHVHQNDYVKAEEMLRKAWVMFRKILGDDDLQSATVAFRLGQVLDEMENFDHAIDYYGDSLRVREMKLGSEHEMVGTTLFYMGKNSYARSKFDDAIDFNERALHIRRKALGVNDVVVASTLHSLGRAYWSNGVHDNAMVCYRESVRIWKTAGALNEAGTASFDIAKCHEASNNDEQAVKSYMECIQLFTTNTEELGQELIPTIRHNLGILLEKMGKWLEAITHLEIAYEMYQSRCYDHNLKVSALRSICRSKVMIVHSEIKCDVQIRNDISVPISDNVKCAEEVISSSSKTLLEEDFTEALNSYNKLQILIELDCQDSGELAETYFEIGNIYAITKDYIKAQENYEKSLTIKRNTKNPDDNSTGKILIAIAEVNENVTDFTSASKHAIEALRIFRLKRNDTDAVTSLILLARIYESSCNTKAAIECFEECLKLKKQMARDSDLSVASTLHAYACFLIRTSDEDKALELLNAAVRIRKVELGIHHLVTAESVHKIGEVLLKKCQYEKSLKYILQALQVKIKVHGRDHEDVGTSQYLAGVINAECGRFEAAIPFLQDALRIKTKSNTRKLDMACTLHHLGQAFWKISDFDKAIHYLTKASTIRKQELGHESMDYADSLECLGCAYYCSKKSNEALHCLVDSLRIHEQNKNEDMNKARIQEWIGKTFFRLEKYDEALSIFLQCQPVYQNVMGKDHEYVAGIFMYMGKIQVKLQSYDIAMGYFKQSLNIYKKRGSKTTSVAEVLIEIGDLFLLQAENFKALDCFNESVRIMKDNNTVDDEGIASALRNAGRANLEVRNYPEAMRSLKEARSIYSIKYGDECVEVGETLALIARVFEGISKFSDAIAYYMDAINTLKKHINDDNLSLAPIFHRLGLIYMKEKKFLEAEKTLTLALNIRRKRLNNNHADIADTLVSLANVKVENSENSKAIFFYKEARDIYVFQEKHMSLAKCLESMACLQLEADELDDALSLYSKAWKLCVAHEADDSIEAASILFGLGVVHHKKSKHEEAFNFLKRCLNLYMVKKGKDTLDVAKTCEELGHVLVSMERYEDALKVYDTALGIFQDLFGENHLHCASINLHVGDIFSYLRKYDVALQHYEASLEIFMREYGENSKEVADVFLSIGKIHDLQVDMEKAMKYMSGALKIQIGLYGKDSVNVADTLLKIAHVLEDWGDTDEAMDRFRDALRIYQLKLGQGDVSAAVILKHIGSIHYERDEFGAALEAYKEAILIYKQKLGEYSGEVGHILQDMGAVYDSMNEHDNSLKCYSEALLILKKSLGNDNLAVAAALNNLGINLARRKEYSKAIEFCTDALRIRKVQLSESHLDIADTLFNIGYILDDWGKNNDHTMRFYSEALSIYRSNLGDDNEDVANCVRNMGVLKLRKDKINEAIPLLLDALRIFRLKTSDSLDVAGILFHLGRIYGKQTNYDKSLGCFKECLRIRMEQLNHDNPDIVSTRRIVDNIERKLGR